MAVNKDRLTIFVMGVCPRTGTNMAAGLLCLHPDASLPVGIWEDYLMANGDDLLDYVDRCAHWYSRWEFSEADKHLLMSSIGSGLEQFLAERSTTDVTVTKTPRVHNLDYVPYFFPRSPIVVMIRDGRSTTESLMKTFGLTFDQAVLAWRDGMRSLNRAMEDPMVAERASVFRYEDLHQDIRSAVFDLLPRCGLDVSSYDMGAAESMPVLGSSELKKDGGVHWNPVEKPLDFDPTTRFAHWTEEQHERFTWLAGAEQLSAGYDLDQHAPNAARQRLLDLRLAAGQAKSRSQLAPLRRSAKRLLRKPLTPADYPHTTWRS